MVELLQPVVKRRAESLAADALKAHVLSGAVVPGQRLTEAALAARLCVSRATVRTALHQLAQEGLVHQIPCTGWEVARFGVQDAWELYTLRSSLEALAARLAADRRRHEDESSIIAAMARLEQACRGSQRSAIADADFDLHRTIIRLAGHRRLLEQCRLIKQQNRLYGCSSDALLPDPIVLLAQHAPIADAIREGRGAQAAKLTERHYLEQGEKLVAYLQSKETPTLPPF